MGLVAMPADADPYIVFSAKDLSDMGIGAVERFDLRDDPSNQVGIGSDCRSGREA